MISGRRQTFLGPGTTGPDCKNIEICLGTCSHLNMEPMLSFMLKQ